MIKAVPGIKKIRFHDLRHTFASQYVMNGGSIYTLKEILGHRDIKMTLLRYAHLSPDHLKGATDFLNFEKSSKEKVGVNPNLTPNGEERTGLEKGWCPGRDCFGRFSPLFLNTLTSLKKLVVPRS